MELISLLPDYYDKNVTMRLLQEILSGETDKLEVLLDQAVAECFASTASQLLSRYEKMLGLETDVTKEEELRRERIYAKLSGFGTTTKAMVVEVASRYSKGEVEVVEDNAHYTFTIRFVGTVGIPDGIEDLRFTIEEIKPAHLAVLYEYMFNTWKNVSAYTWGQAGTHTWEEIRTVKI